MLSRTLAQDMKGWLSSFAMSVREIIQSLGGPAAIGRQLGCRSQAVSQWAAHNRIPLQRIFALEQLAREQGLPVRAQDMRPDMPWGVLRD